MHNGTEILFRSLDAPERLTNLEVDWFALDEIGEVKLETFRMLQGRLRKLGGCHRGVVVGNPAGPTHWTFDYYVHKAKLYPEAYRLVHATSYENLFLDPSYTLEMERSYGKDSPYYKRFVLGLFVAFEGAYYPHFSIEPWPKGHVCELPEVDGILGQPRRFGRVIDFGYEHPFCCLWYATDNTKIIFYDEYYQRHRTIKEHCLKIRAMDEEHMSRWGFPYAPHALSDHEAIPRAEIEHCVDDTGQSIGFPCIPGEKRNVLSGILLVQSMIERHLLLITDRCKETRMELPSYRAKAEDKSTKETPYKVRDHTCDCVRMACMTELAHMAPHLRKKEFEYTSALHVDPLEYDQHTLQQIIEKTHLRIDL